MIKRIIITIILIVSIGVSSTYLYSINSEIIAQRKLEEQLRIEEEERLKEIERQKQIRLKEIESANEIFDSKLPQICKDNRVVGLSIAIFEDGEIIHTVNYGYQDSENKIEANDNTKYRIASISKNITCIGLMKLYEQGKFKLDDYISDITGINYDSSYGRITFKDLLTHTAGIYDYGNSYQRGLMGSHVSIDDALSDGHANYKVGEHYSYSNFGMSSVGAIIEELTGEYFGRYMRDLFTDFGIDAAYSCDLISDNSSIAKLYNGSSVLNVPNWFKTSKFYEDYGLGNSYLQGDGELLISASDLAKIAIALSNGGNYQDKQLLSQDTLNLMFDEYIDVYDEESGVYRYTEGLSCHNFKSLIEGHEIHGHTGSALGAVTAMYFDIDEHNGIVILDNGAANIKDENLNTILLRDLVRECYQDYFD